MADLKERLRSIIGEYEDRIDEIRGYVENIADNSTDILADCVGAAKEAYMIGAMTAFFPFVLAGAITEGRESRVRIAADNIVETVGGLAMLPYNALDNLEDSLRYG